MHRVQKVDLRDALWSRTCSEFCFLKKKDYDDDDDDGDDDDEIVILEGGWRWGVGGM